MLWNGFRNFCKGIVKAALECQARLLAAQVASGPVLDKTGLDGVYDYTFEWPDSGSSLVDSIEQLGLKLESKKEAVEVLVIDRAERPPSN
jgi:uncharacterized protein (TIGR03435 family)